MIIRVLSRGFPLDRELLAAYPAFNAPFVIVSDRQKGLNNALADNRVVYITNMENRVCIPYFPLILDLCPRGLAES